MQSTKDSVRVPDSNDVTLAFASRMPRTGLLSKNASTARHASAGEVEAPRGAGAAAGGAAAGARRPVAQRPLARSDAARAPERTRVTRPPAPARRGRRGPRPRARAAGWRGRGAARRRAAASPARSRSRRRAAAEAGLELVEAVEQVADGHERLGGAQLDGRHFDEQARRLRGRRLVDEPRPPVEQHAEEARGLPWRRAPAPRRARRASRRSESEGRRRPSRARRSRYRAGNRGTRARAGPDRCHRRPRARATAASRPRRAPACAARPRRAAARSATPSTSATMLARDGRVAHVGDGLVEQRQPVPHRARRLPRHQRAAPRLGRDLLRLQHAREVRRPAAPSRSA